MGLSCKCAKEGYKSVKRYVGDSYSISYRRFFKTRDRRAGMAVTRGVEPRKSQGIY